MNGAVVVQDWELHPPSPEDLGERLSVVYISDTDYERLGWLCCGLRIKEMADRSNVSLYAAKSSLRRIREAVVPDGLDVTLALLVAGYMSKKIMPESARKGDCE